MNNITTFQIINSTGEDDNSTEYIITQVFGWITGILALVKIFFFTITLLIKKFAKNISMPFVIVGILGAISAIIFGIRINEISIYVRGVIMLILSIIIFIAKIVFDIEYDRRKSVCDKKISTKIKILTEILEKDTVQSFEEFEVKMGDIFLKVNDKYISIGDLQIKSNNENLKSVLEFLKESQI